MNILIFSLISTGLYALTGMLLAGRLFGRGAALANAVYLRKNWILSTGLIAVLIHMAVLYNNIIASPAGGLNFGFFNAISLMSWLIALLITVASFSKPLENLGVIMFPAAAIAIVLEIIFPSNHLVLSSEVADLRYHILISIMAYSLLTLAAIQAVLLAIQNQYLRNKHPGGFIRALPPLETMESLLFQLLGLSFVFVSLALITGAVYLEDIFAQHLVHKTVLAIISWALLAILLWGRWRFGWRGRTAIRWTLSAFVVLGLSYFGSKLVLELILHR